MRRTFLAVAVVLLLSSCGGTTHVGDVEFRDDRAYVGGEPYSGTMWSDDERSYSLSVEDGVVTSFTLYHANDSAAIAIRPDSTVTYYDADGGELPADTFKSRYAGLYESLPELVSAIHGVSPSTAPEP